MKQIGKARVFVWLLLLLLAGGCTQTDVADGPLPPHALKEVEAGFNLKVLASLPPVARSMRFEADGTTDCDTLPAVDAVGQTHTRATGPLDEGAESRIASLWIGQYEAETGVRLFGQYVAVMTGAEVNVKLKQNADGATSRIWFVANQGDLGEIATEAELKAHTLAYRSGESGLPESGLCGMAGMWEGKVEELGMGNLSVNLSRLLAKITFTYAIGGTGFSFTPTAVALCAAPQKIQVEAPTAQLAEAGYTTYSGTADATGATIYWYLPENMAGTASGEYAVDSEKKKTGKGTTHATYIELIGTATQGGVEYKQVAFRFYPGSSKNNYDLVRNSHYIMDVTLIGIDITDQRITVGEIPPIVVDPAKMPAVKGGTKEVLITARPGQEWELKLPDWLSAAIDGTQAPAGANIAYQGPATVVFSADAANQTAQDKSAAFPFRLNAENQTITIVQAGSTLQKGADISLDAASGAEGGSSFTATEGLNWMAVLGAETWLGWATSNPATQGDEATGEPQALSVAATTSNPLAQPRAGVITVKAGASVGDASYTDLKQEIAVTQAASTAAGSALTVGAEAATGQASTFTATPGLAWMASVISDSWITLTGATSGNPTTGSSQNVTFSVPVNPTASPRTDAITVRAGDASQGPTATIAVTQSASALAASASVPTLPPTADAGGTLTLNGTSGLNLSVTIPDWLSLSPDVPSTTNGSDQRFYYKASLNLNAAERSEDIRVAGGEITQNIPIIQEASEFKVSKNIVNLPVEASEETVEVTATTGLPWTVTHSGDANITTITEGGVGNSTITFNASENKSIGRSATFTLAVTGATPARTLTVQAMQKAFVVTNIAGGYQVAPANTTTGAIHWDVAMSACANLSAEGFDDWILPSKDALLAIYADKGSLGAVYTFISYKHWSSNGRLEFAYCVDFSNGSLKEVYTINDYHGRCVRIP